jgi:cell division septum initiation protein DivIVA
VNASDDTGLGLFDDTASAVGNFPTALRGYDRTAVDDYVRTLEANVVQSRRHVAALQQQINSLQDQLQAPGKHDGGELDYAGVGGRANDILRLAQEQARDMVESATIEVAKLKEAARREADAVRTNAVREGDHLRSGGLAEVDQLRARLHEDIQGQLHKAKEEAAALLAAARRQAEAARREAEHEAQTIRQSAHLDTENLRRTVEREAAEARQRIAAEREAAAGSLRKAHGEASAKTSAMLAEASKRHQESAARLEADITQAAKIREEAFAEAEQVKIAAAKESEERIETAKKQAAGISERTQQEFAWRKQQLRRETELLHERKRAVLGQLASLSALAQETAQSFPELEEPTELEREQGDQTVLRPPNLDPSLPKADKAGRGKQDSAKDSAIAEEPTVNKGDDSAGKANPEADSTVRVAASDRPAGVPQMAADAENKNK